MQCTTGWRNWQGEWGAIAHTVAVVMLVLLSITGHQVEGLGGWLACPPRVIKLEEGRRPKRPDCGGGFAWRVGWAWMRESWVVAAACSEALMVLMFLTEWWEWEWVCVLPWVMWIWKGLGVGWPRLGRQGWYRWVGRIWEEASRVARLWLALRWFYQHASSWEQGVWGAAVGGVTRLEDEGRAQVEVAEDESGIYHVHLSGTFELHMDGTVEFYKRMLVIFLGLLEAPGETRGSRRTRDGRTPFVRQQQMAAWFGVPQPHISRWFKYWLERDWRRMLSQKWGEILTEKMRQRVIDGWAAFPWWSARRMWEHLLSQGSRITLPQVKQIGRESGWTLLRQRLRKRYQISAESFRPRDEWLVEQLLGQVQRLVERLEALGGLTDEQQIALADLEALCYELHLRPAPARRALPWVLRVEGLLFGHWEWVEDETVRCIYCGTTDVSRKSRKPRWKRYVDEKGEEQKVAVYRYYCHNPGCTHKTFTNLPPNLIPYSKWTLDHHLAALQTYAQRVPLHQPDAGSEQDDDLPLGEWLRLPVAAGGCFVWGAAFQRRDGGR